MASFMLFAIFFFSAIIFFILFSLTWIVFGKIMKLQLKRWFMASKGYVEVEHVSATKVRNYFIMRPSENKFNLDDGFYHYITECVTRKGDIIHKYDKSFLTKNPEFLPEELEGMSDKEQIEYKALVTAKWNEIRNLYKVISNMKYDPEQLSRKLGMPVITYYGDNPDPLNFAQREKAYGSGVIKDMYLRLLLTQRFKDFQMIIAVFMICIVVLAIAIFGLWRVHLTDSANYHACISLINASNSRYELLVNSTFSALSQSSIQVIR